MSRARDIVAAVDVGAGSGAKLGLFDAGRDGIGLQLLAEEVVPVASYGGAAETMADALADAVRDLLQGISSDPKNAPPLAAVGIACPGLFKSDGTTITAANLDFLGGASLPALLGKRLGVPAAIANDADAGGLAEWAVAREEFLYWVLGGGWGGAWVSREGRVMFPSTDWDGADEALHHTNEPGYSVPLARAALRQIFADEGGSIESFEGVVRADLGDGALVGPGGRADALRAETVVSGPGRLRVFRSLAGADTTLTADEQQALADPASAGAVVTALGERGVDAAVRTDRVFGRALAEAGAAIIASAERDGCERGVPIRIAGGPAKALHLFGPHAMTSLQAKGFANSLCASCVESDGRNANLLGAAVMAAGLRAKA